MTVKSLRYLLALTLIVFSYPFAAQVYAQNPGAKAHLEMTTDSNSRDESQLREIVSAMWAAWVKQDLDAYAGFFSEDTDWENAFGWRLRGRPRLKEFLAGYLWPFQKGVRYDRVSYRVAAISSDLALIEFGIEGQLPTAGQWVKRRVRQTHILRRKDAGWKVVVTRIWDPRTDVSSPIDRFPEFKDAPFSDMQQLNQLRSE